MKNQTEQPTKTARALVLALSLVSFVGLAACTTTSTNASDSETNKSTSINGDYVRRAERIADQMPRGKGI